MMIPRMKIKHIVTQSLALSLALMSLANSAWAIPERDYLRAYSLLVEPFYTRFGISGSFKGQGDVEIQYRKFELPFEKGAIVFAPGRAESFVKYGELAYDLVSRGYSVYMIDHRGQGLSGRMTSNHQIGYVDSYEDYVDDLKTFVDTVVGTHSRRFLLTNSMGGAIGALYLERHPQDFDAAALSVPMFEINLGKYPETIALGIAAFNLGRNKDKEYALEQHDRELIHRMDPGSKNGRELREYIEEEQLIAQPKLAVGGVSYRWIYESILEGRKIRSPEFAIRVQTPILILQGGLDIVVKPGAQNRFCLMAPHCQKEFYPTASHSILSEKDSIRDEALKAITGFFEQY